jgi:adenylate kinase family enzyme
MTRLQGMRRVVVAGITGAGKSTFARALAVALDLPFVELDGFVEGPGWTVLPDFRERTAEMVGTDSWVTDNLWYPEVEDLLLGRADTVVWLDLPRAVIVRRLVRRTLRRGLPPRPVLVNGNRERLWAVLLPSSPLRTAWSGHADHRARLERRLAGFPGEVVRLQTSGEAAAWLRETATRGPGRT